MTAQQPATIWSAGEEARQCLPQDAGWRVVHQRTAELAEALAAGRPDLLLMEFSAATPELCGRAAAFRIPVVLICRDEQSRAEGLAAGAEACFARPVESRIVAATVAALLRARRLENERDRLLERAALLNEQRFQVALKGSPIYVWNQDLELRYTWAYNVPPQLADPLGKTDEELLAPEDLPRVLAMKRRALITGKGVREEVSLSWEGESRYFDITLEPLYDDTGAVAGLTGAAVDITDHKRLEAKLRQAQKLESIGVLAGGVAHDFNNLLTAILGNASLALEQVPPGHPARAEIEAVIQGSQRAAGLTSQLLAYSGKGQFVLEEVDLSEMVDGVLSLVRTSIPKPVRLHLALKAGLPRIAGDEAQLQQLLMNLALNAGEAIGERDGTIRIHTGLQQLSPYYIERNAMAASDEIKPGTYVYLEVRDTGCGMDEATKARIFDPFFTTKFTGRGLGLAAVQGIVRGHGGTIELHSTPGKGTTFKVLLPTAARARPRAAVATLGAGVRGSGTVLVVDGDPLIRRLVQSVLEKNGYSVCLASDGRQALEVFSRESARFDAVLLDAGIPETAGAAVLRQMLEQRPALPVVVSSGYPESEVLRELPSGRRPLFLQKPYTAAEVLEIMRWATQ